MIKITVFISIYRIDISQLNPQINSHGILNCSHLMVTHQAKAAIRELLPRGLRESISKVRSSVAYAVSAIAHWDWPEAWPQLFTLLMEMLVSGDVNAVHGAMRVLTGI